MAIHHNKDKEDTKPSKEHLLRRSIHQVKSLKENTNKVVHQQAQRLIEDDDVPNYQVPKLQFLLVILAVIVGLILIEKLLPLL